jgi:nucleoside-diphosphate-sugar epimerase
LSCYKITGNPTGLSISPKLLYPYGMATTPIKKVLVAGGAGYVGSVLVPKLLRAGFEVVVLDTYWFGPESLRAVRYDPALFEVRGDLRNRKMLAKLLKGVDAVVDLVAVFIPQDANYEQNPRLGKSINRDAQKQLIKLAKANQVRRFIFGSSAGVYGLPGRLAKSETDPVFPPTDYEGHKIACEQTLFKEGGRGFACVALRIPSVCGLSPRQRMDVGVNSTVSLAHHFREAIAPAGGNPFSFIHVDDLGDLILHLLRVKSLASRKPEIYNISGQALTMERVARTVQAKSPKPIRLSLQPHSVQGIHLNTSKWDRHYKFRPRRTVASAVGALFKALEAGRLTDTLTDTRYDNWDHLQGIAIVE